jgi:hypothetical protein
LRISAAGKKLIQMNPPKSKTFYVAQEGRETFELNETDFREKVFSGEISPMDDYFCEGMKEWRPVSEYRRFGTLGERPVPVKPSKIVELQARNVITIDAQSGLGFLGSIILFLGVFAPVVSVPIAGAMNYFQNGVADGSIVMVAGIISAILTARRKFWPLWISGGIALGCVLVTFGMFKYKMAQLRTSMSHDLKDNPFADLARVAVDAVQLQWGLPLLAIGAAMILVAAAIGTGRIQIRRP